MSTQAAYDYIVKNAGATKPARDSDDQRIIQNLVTRKGNFLDDKELAWPELDSGTSPADSDRDGIPDTWESKYFREASKRASVSSSSDSDGDGYTDFEEYLNGTNPLARD
jgi:hypothetical protein